MKAYYAHCLAIYNTKQEERDLETLNRLGFQVLNPNKPEYSQLYQEKGMKVFEELAKSCDLVAFRGLPDGSIPAGIAKEIKAAQEANKPVIELPSCVLRRELDVEQTREYLKEIGQR